MQDLMASAKRFFKNKNTVTILGIIIIAILLFWGYSSQINKAVEPVQIPVATETIQPRTEITDDMVTLVDMPNISISDNVIRLKSSIVGKYSNVNTVIPEGSMFYMETIINKDEIPDAAFTKVKADEVAYNFPVDMESTYGNSIFPGNKIDIYMKVGNGSDQKVMVGKLIENIEVLAVKDSSGRAVFENTAESRTPSMLIFGLKENLNLLLKKASYMNSLGVELYPVPSGGSVDTEGTTQVSTQELVDFIEANSINIAIAEETESTKVDKLAPVMTQSGTNPIKIAITYPKGCGSTYTCTYSKDGGRAVTVKKTSQSVSFTKNGTLVATVTEKDGTVHKFETEVPMTNSTNAGQ